MKTIITQIAEEKARVQKLLQELTKAIDLIQSTEQEEFKAFTANSTFLRANDLISENCSEEELHQHYEYYEGYKNGLTFVLSLFSNPSIGG